MDAATKIAAAHGEMSFSRPTDDGLLVRLSGSWKMQDKLPSHTEVEQQVASGPRVKRVAFDTQGITAWDSGLVTFLLKILTQNTQNQIETDQAGLPEGVRRLLALATAVPEREGAAKKVVRIPLLVRVGKGTIAAVEEAKGMLAFLGEALLAFLTFLRGKARFRRSDLFLIIQESGANALGIVTLISFLVGLILAFMGGIQLRQFAAEIFVANLVGLGMIREMAPIMTGIIMAGRTGAAFAAQLGTMQVNEEIDALKVLGLSPMEFLVLPRMLALVLMMPLLTLYADLVSILGGLVVAQGFGISATEYVIQTMKAVHLHDLAVGLFKSAVFGVIVAISGCLRGIQCGRSAQAVGEATTSAVVMSIVLIITLDGIFAVVTDAIGL
jgi:phospholipid/cholesterol/gamma-HCH transport system permease protein